MQALEKYESNPEDVGEAFQEWVSKNEQKKHAFVIKILPPNFFVFFYFPVYLSHKMNKMFQLHIIVEDILIVLVSVANQNRAFSLSIVLVFNKSLRLINSRRLNPCLLSHYCKNFNLKPDNRFTD